MTGIKFLKGYGISIKQKNNQVYLTDGADPFTGKRESESYYITNLPYEKIVLCGKGYISTDALGLLCEHNKNLILCDTYGKPISYINPVKESQTATKYRMGQYDTFRNPDKKKYLTMQILKAKTKSQIRFLELTKNPDAKDAIKILKDSLENFDGPPLVTEANLGRIYFEEYVKLIPKRFRFTSRNRNSILISKNKATDVINALLNYGYCVLAGEISKYISSIGLDAYYGFYHKKETGFQLLVYDLLEPFRWLVDYSVYKLANSISTKQRIKQREYSHTKEGLVVMECDLIRRFLELLERTFSKERRYAFSHGAKTQDGLKSCQEITIARIAVQNLADYCIGKSNTFAI